MSATSELSVERYEPSQREEWDALVRSCRARHFLFERAYMDYHRDRFVDHSFVVRLASTAIAALPASRHGEEVRSHGGLTFGGLVSRAELTTVRAIEALRAISESLASAGVRLLTYKPMPYPYQLEPAQEDLFALFVLGARLERREVTVAVAPGERPAYSEERRRGVKRAARAGLVYEESARFGEFMAVLASMLAERHDTEPVHSLAEIELLAAAFPDSIRLHVATDHGEIVAGTVIYLTPTVAHAQYIAASEAGRELRALDGLFDHLLTEVYRDRWFDFGISNERDGQLNAGLNRFKEGFGARAVMHDRYALAIG